jgi:hypothetical protein
MTQTLLETIKKQLATEVAAKVSDAMFENMMDLIHEIATDVCDEHLGSIVDHESEEYYDLIMDICGRISIVAV